jgi:hypothetical protein
VCRNYDWVRLISTLASAASVRLMTRRDSIDRAFVEFGEKRIGAVLALGDPINYRERARIGLLSKQRRLPVCGFPDGVQEGLLLGYGYGAGSQALNPSRLCCAVTAT